jgi:lactoylglutathione lyase
MLTSVAGVARPPGKIIVDRGANRLPPFAGTGALDFACAPAACSAPREHEGVMKYLHTMVRIRDIDRSLDFYCNKLGMKEVRRYENAAGRFTLIFLAASEDLATAQGEMESTSRAPCLELTYNWDAEDYTGGRNFGHLAFAVDDIHALCASLMRQGVTINRPPRDGRMAFIRSPDGISIELLQKGAALAPVEPWISMPNSGSW